MKYQFIEDHRDQYPVTLMCQVLEVVRSSYYQWRKQPLSRRKMAGSFLFGVDFAAFYLLRFPK